jgi:hypothetical protein
MPFRIAGKPHYLAYKIGSGQVSIDRLKTNGHGVETLWGKPAGGWSKDWTTFMPFELGGQPHYLAYKVDTGQVTIDRVNPTGQDVTTVWGKPAGGWGKGWTTFMPFELGGQPHYLAYKVDTGQVTIDRINPTGQDVTTVWGKPAGGWSNGWTTFMPFELGGQPHYLAYKVDTGQVTIDRVNPTGQDVTTVWGKPAGGWTKGWTSFVPFSRGGQPHYMAYGISNGQVTVDRIRPNGQDVDTIWNGSWSTGWSSFMSYLLAGQPRYLGYKKDIGQMTLGRFMPWMCSLACWTRCHGTFGAHNPTRGASDFW